jgi:energy-coupling factor transporter transmembrane protein EcfT
VYAIGTRVASRRAGTIAAVASTLNPYLVWHDVHLNREILDQLVGAALVLGTLVAADRRSGRWAAAAGVCAGLALLGNGRLLLLPLVLAGYLVWRTGWSWAPLALVAAAAIAVTPWVVRNRVQVGCFALTTDGRALWKANNEQTYDVLASGRWIDDVRDPPGHPYPNPEEAHTIYVQTGEAIHVPECGNANYYQRRVRTFLREHPGEKARLAGQAVRMEWDPRATKTEGRTGRGSGLDTGRDWAQPIYSSVLFALGLVGLFVVSRWFAMLAVALLAYQMLAAVAFVGATRYRVAWDFVIAVLAAVALDRALVRRRSP